LPKTMEELLHCRDTYLSQYLSLSYTHTLIHTHSHTLIHTHTHSHILTHTHTHSYTLTHILLHTHIHSRKYILSLTLKTHSLALSICGEMDLNC
jgi:hypothetical protein